MWETLNSLRINITCKSFLNISRYQKQLINIHFNHQSSKIRRWVFEKLLQNYYRYFILTSFHYIILIVKNSCYSCGIVNTKHITKWKFNNILILLQCLFLTEVSSTFLVTVILSSMCYFVGKFSLIFLWTMSEKGMDFS